MSARPSDRLVLAIVDATPLLVDDLGEQPFDSVRQAADALAEALPWSPETIRRALRDPRLAAEVDRLVDPRPTARPTARPTKSPSDPRDPSPQVNDAPPAPHPETTPHVSTRPLSDSADPGPSQHPRPVHGRRPREVRRSSFPGRCVICSLELEVGDSYYLTPYDTGTITACLEHAALALAGAQMLYDVSRGRNVPEELELVIRPRPTR